MFLSGSIPAVFVGLLNFFFHFLAPVEHFLRFVCYFSALI